MMGAQYAPYFGELPRQFVEILLSGKVEELGQLSGDTLLLPAQFESLPAATRAALSKTLPSAGS